MFPAGLPWAVAWLPPRATPRSFDCCLGRVPDRPSVDEPSASGAGSIGGGPPLAPGSGPDSRAAPASQASPWRPGRPWRPAASDLVVVPSTTPGSLSSNAWSARLRSTSPRHNAGRRFLCALHCVPSWVLVCAQLSGHGSIRSGGAALTIETEPKFQIGPTSQPASGDLVVLWPKTGREERDGLQRGPEIIQMGVRSGSKMLMAGGDSRMASAPTALMATETGPTSDGDFCPLSFTLGGSL